MTTITPNTGSLSLTGLAPTPAIDRRIAPGETSLGFTSYAPLVTVDINSLVLHLPTLYATFTDRRQLIRQTTDPVRDLIWLSRQTEIWVAFEQNGELVEANTLSGFELLYENADETVEGSILVDDYPAVFDTSMRAVIRGQDVSVLRIILSETVIAEIFDAGLWTIEVYAVDDDHPAGTLWGFMEWEVRSLFDGVVVVPAAASLTMTGYAPSVLNYVLAGVTGSLTMSGLQAQVTAQAYLKEPLVGSLTLSGLAPVRTP